MTLFDTDKSNVDRTQPKPNRVDRLNPLSVQAKGTNSVNYVTPSTNLSSIQGGKNGQFTIVQVQEFTTTTTFTPSNPGAGNYVAGTVPVYQAPHNLPFTPGIFAYEQQSSGQFTPMPYAQYSASGTANGYWGNWIIYVDATYVYIQLLFMVYGNTSVTVNPGFIFKWYLTSQTSN